MRFKRSEDAPIWMQHQHAFDQGRHHPGRQVIFSRMPPLQVKHDVYRVGLLIYSTRSEGGEGGWELEGGVSSSITRNDLLCAGRR